MMYDPLTELFVPLFFMLATSQTQDFYKKLFQCIKFAVGVKPNPKAVVCDFETALIFAHLRRSLTHNYIPASAIPHTGLGVSLGPQLVHLLHQRLHPTWYSP
ncbi:hypothetical protein PC116_g25074 [Phytophthora cactorum]|nr:hypothetical protein PC116_g25074 [Phytophthora cactorum]